MCFTEILINALARGNDFGHCYGNRVREHLGPAGRGFRHVGFRVIYTGWQRVLNFMHGAHDSVCKITHRIDLKNSVGFALDIQFICVSH